MTEEEQFQYVVSSEDYSDFKTSQAKCRELANLLAESENLHSQDKYKYLFKIDKLEDELKSYKNSIRQYVDKEVKEVDNLLKILHDYKSIHSKSSIDEKTFNMIKSECDKISQTFNVSLKNLEILNSEVINVIKSLIEDSLALQQKLKEFSQRYENAMEQREDLYEEVRQLTEKGMFSDKEREKLTKSQQRMMNQTELLKIGLRQKQDQYTQHKIACQKTKNKLNSEIKILKDEMSFNEKKWKECEKKLQKEASDLRNDKLVSTRTMIEEIERLRQKNESLAKQCMLKQSKVKGLQVAYKQQSEQLDLQQSKAQQKQVLLTEKLQRQKAGIETVASKYSIQIKQVTTAYEERLLDRQHKIRQFQQSLADQSQLTNELKTQLKTSSQMIAQLKLANQQIKQTFGSEKNQLLQQIQRSQQEINQKQLQITAWQHQLQLLNKQLQEYLEKYKIQTSSLDKLKKQALNHKNTITNLQNQLISKNQRIKKIEEEHSKHHQIASQQIDQLRRTIAICETQKNFLQDNAKSITQQLLILQKSSQEDKNKQKSTNQQLSYQINILASNVDKKTIELEELQKAYTDTKSAKNYAENQFYSMKQAFEKEKKKSVELKEKLSIVGNESSMLRQTVEESQMSNESLLKEIEHLRDQFRSSRQVQEASHLLKMNVNTLQTEVERLQKENIMFKKERQLFGQQMNSAKEEIKFLNDDMNSMRQYIDELEQNLQKLSEQKAALKNEVSLFKEQAEFCKKASIDQLKVIDELERELETARYVFDDNFRMKYKNATQSVNPTSIIKRSSLSKGEKSYYVKEMILEYGNEMKKNLDQIGALSHEEVKDLIFSELRELGNYLKKVEKEFE